MQANPTNPIFLSCDWGTSSFRLRLIATDGLQTIAETKSDTGIRNIYETWQQETQNEAERLPYYTAYLQQQIEKLEQQINTSLDGIAVVLSGMASSSIGMKELPYKPVPFHTDGRDLYVSHIKSSTPFQHDIILISGTQTTTDVMRGEETQLAGYFDARSETQLVIIPGTHSKHIRLQENKVVDFKTYMTGEVFDLLSKKSILAGSITAIKDFLAVSEWVHFFCSGVEAGATQNFLNALFSVRTHALFKKFTPEANYIYLSGLVIGAELKDLPVQDYLEITVLGNEYQNELYRTALLKLYPAIQVLTSSADAATIRGQYKILSQQ